MANTTQTRTRNYSAGMFMLEIAGNTAGFLHAVEGGEPFAAVVNEPVDENGIVRKHVGPTQFAPIRISFGTGMSKAVYDWISEVLSRGGAARSGAIVFCDYHLAEQWRLEFDNALVTEVAFPALDGSAKTLASLSLTLQPQTTRVSQASTGTSLPAFSSKSQLRWYASNFRLNISGLGKECASVNKIDSIVVKQPLREGGTGTLDIPNLTFTLLSSMSKEFSNWFDEFVLKGNNAAENERAGFIEFLHSDLKTVLFVVTFRNLGIVRIWQERTEDQAEVTARTGVELYCEEMAFTKVNDAILGSAIETKPPADQEGGGKRNLLLDDTFQFGPGAGKPIDPVQPEAIARRLLGTIQPAVADPSVTRRNDGIALGKQWATENATLEELQQISALESGEWTAMKLDNEHSLIAQLRDAGVVPPGGDGPVDLDRDDFVQGLVTGASEVLRSATPHLSK